MITLKCNKHPKYKGQISPKANCYECFALYKIALEATKDRLSVS